MNLTIRGGCIVGSRVVSYIWVDKVGIDFVKFVLRVASPDAVRCGRPNRYARVSRHMSHEFEIFQNIFQTRTKTFHDGFE